MRSCIPCFLKSGQYSIEVKDLVSVDDLETPCESPLHLTKQLDAIDHARDMPVGGAGSL